jgi:ribose-phosphate pyrophosphokinase
MFGNNGLKDMRIISATENDSSARSISEYLNVPLIETYRKEFRDTDKLVKIADKESVRGKDVYLISTYTPPLSERLQEHILWTDALVSGSADRLTIVAPYLYGGRQDRKNSRGEPINFRAYIKAIMGVAGEHASRIAFMTADLHSEQVQGYAMYFDSLRARHLFAEQIKKNYQDVRIIAPDTGAFKTAAILSKDVNAGDINWVTKTRGLDGETENYGISGPDLTGKTAIVLDDMIDSGGTLISAARAARDAGAKDVVVYSTHLLLTVPENIKEIDAKIIGTDTVYHPPELLKDLGVTVLPLSSVFAEAIKRKHKGESTDDLYTDRIAKATGLEKRL